MAVPLHKDLIKAIKTGNEEKLNILLKGDGISAQLNARDKKGRQALHIACKSKRAKLLTNLLKHSSDIFSKCSRGYTPLHYACRSASLPCIIILLEMGAEPRSSQDNQGKNPLDLIPEKKQNTLGTLLRNALNNYTQMLKNLRVTPNNEFLQQFILDDRIGLICLDDIQLNRKNELAKGPRTTFCHGTYHNLNVMVKYENEHYPACKTLRDELIGIRQLGDHVNILETLGVTCSDDNILQIIFPHPGYGFLHRVLFHSNLILNSSEVLGIGRDVANALRYIHDQGFLHCAVATFSVVLSKDLEAKICNLNYLQDRNRALPISHYPSLFPYMSHRQRQGHPCDQQNDIYGMGVTIYECVTRCKIQEVEKEINTRNPKEAHALKMKQIPITFDIDVKILIDACMDPVKRFSVNQIYQWLEGTTRGEVITLLQTETTAAALTKILQLS